MSSLSELSTDELADGICLRAGRLAAGQAELLVWIGEFDRREGWAGTGLLSCAHWLSWRLGLSLGAAREQVRVARRLPELPQIAQAFAEGRVSYSKVRAITRVADPEDGVDWVQLARNSTAEQLEQIVRGLRRAQANEAAEQDPEEAAWSLRTRLRWDDRGNFALTITGPAEHLPVVQAGLEAKKAELQRQRDAEAAAAVEQEPDLPAEVPGPVPADGDVPAGTPELTAFEARDRAADDRDEPDLDAQAVGWPPGTTYRDVREAMASWEAGQEALLRTARADSDSDSDSEPTDLTAEAHELDADVPAGTSPAATPPEVPSVTDADALLALAQEALEAEQAAHPGVARRRRPQLAVRIDPLSGWARHADGELLPPTSLRTVLKTLPGRGGVLRLRPLADADLRRYDLGRSSRDASPALRELLGAIDGERCRFPGCTRRKKLHAHHVRYWSAGGGTDLDNLLLVCARHHTLIHSQGFQLVLLPDRTLQVRTADGTPVLHHPATPWGDPAELGRGCGRGVSAETLPPDTVSARMDLGYIVNVLMTQAA